MSPERPIPLPPEQGPQPKQERPFYYEAAHFPNEQFSGLVYFAIQEIVFNATEEDLSVYRFQLRHLWHVAALGARPAQEIRQQIHTELEKGGVVELPADIVEALKQRRAEQIKLGSWVEGHYQPGIAHSEPPPEPPPRPLYQRKPKKP